MPDKERPIIFGEVLFDTFPDGTAVLGGAPFNVAWHLAGFQLNPLFISRVGRDAPGRRVLATMNEWGMDVAGVQQDRKYPTGAVAVHLHPGGHSFEILPDQAYDFIDATGALDVIGARPARLLYCGTLITRGPVSRRTLDRIRTQTGLPVFVDINLRTPWWTREGVKSILRDARWAKLNDEEIESVADRRIAPEERLHVARGLCREYRLELLVLTLGADGACFVQPEEDVIAGRPANVEVLVDTVGAGDAFSAVTLMGLIRGWTLEQTLERALAFAARICGQRGATAPDRALYEEFLKQWSHEPAD